MAAKLPKFRTPKDHKRRFELSLHLFHELQAEEYQSINDPKLLLDIIHTAIEQYEEGEDE